MTLPDPIRRALLLLAARFELDRIDFQVGGSVLLALSGAPLTPRDLDLVFRPGDRGRVEGCIGELVVTGPVPPSGRWRSTWLISGRVEKVPVDLIGGPALQVDGSVRRFPFVTGGVAQVDGRAVPIAPLDQWAEIYRVVDRGKAEAADQLSAGGS